MKNAALLLCGSLMTCGLARASTTDATNSARAGAAAGARTGAVNLRSFPIATDLGLRLGAATRGRTEPMGYWFGSTGANGGASQRPAPPISNEGAHGANDPNLRDIVGSQDNSGGASGPWGSGGGGGGAGGGGGGVLPPLVSGDAAQVPEPLTVASAAAALAGLAWQRMRRGKNRGREAAAVLSKGAAELDL